VSEQHSSHAEIKMAMPAPQPDQITGTLARLVLFSSVLLKGASGISATPGPRACISPQEYSNSSPQFKQTWYVRFLIVNTAVR